MELKCTLDAVKEPVTKGNFTGREVWVTTVGEYPQKIKLDCSGKSLDIFNAISPGATVVAHINVRGNEWTNPKDQTVSRFVSLQCWRVEAAGQAVQQQQAMAVTDIQPIDDLPF